MKRTVQESIDDFLISPRPPSFSQRKLATRLVLVFILALFIRLLPYPAVFKGNTVFFDGPDAYYHMKRVLLTVQYFPTVPAFDPYTNYPHGGYIIWPPLFDFFIALIAKVVGLGNPSTYLTEVVGALVPPIIGALTIFPIYLLAREIFNSTIGLYSALFLAVLPAHVTISTIGMTDQHLAEVFCSTFTFVALLRLISRFEDPEVGGRVPASRLLGIGMAGCILVWQGSVVFIGFITLYLLIYLGYQAFRKKLDTSLLREIVKAYLLALLFIGTVTFWYLWNSGRFTILSYVTFSWFHFFFTLLCLILILLLSLMGSFRQKPKEQRRRMILPAILLSLSLLALTLLLGSSILKGAIYLANRTDETVLRENEVIQSSSKAWIQTISEYKPLFFIEGSFDTSYAEKVLSRIFYLVPFFWVYFAVKVKKSPSGDFYRLFFLLAWTLLSGFMALFQHRYTYLFSVVCSIYLGFFVEKFFRLLQAYGNLWKTKSPFFQILVEQKTGLGVLFAMVIWILFPGLQYLSGLSKLPVGPPRDIYQTLLQLKQLSPEPGDFYSLRQQPQYGILANWSFGRWINYIGHRPAIADNDGYAFEESTRFFLAEDEDTANQILTEKKARYILVSDLLRAFPRYAAAIGLNPATYFEMKTLPQESGQTQLAIPTERFYSLMQTRLYEFDGTAIKREKWIPALEHYRLLYESDTILSEGRPRPVHWIKVFEYVPGARIIGKTRAEIPVSILLKVQTNQQRIFSYLNVTRSDMAGNFKFTVPYSTDKSIASIHTSDFYLLKCDTGLQQVQVDEEAIRRGKDIILERACE
ncbi:MAG TPA: STT3 domain-containing protein [Candidatus Limnocylindrales bacterium]|nr:STT3 domain-containing protein [Candidatus Limnocylindrales bacterium]